MKSKKNFIAKDLFTKKYQISKQPDNYWQVTYRNNKINRKHKYKFFKNNIQPAVRYKFRKLQTQFKF